MARSGKVIESPSTRLVFVDTAADTDGELLRVEQFVQPGAPRVAEHIHPGQEERFTVLSGAMGVKVAGRERVLGVGETVAVPPGTPHAFWNAGEEELRQRVELRPALATETFFETTFGLQRDGKLSEEGVPNLLMMAPVALAGEVFLPKIPIPLQKVIFGVLAFLGRFFGYRSSYPRYSDSLDYAAAPDPVKQSFDEKRRA